MVRHEVLVLICVGSSPTALERIDMTKLNIRINKSTWTLYLKSGLADDIDYIENEIRVNLSSENVRKRLLRMLTKVIRFEYEDEPDEPENIDVLNAADRILDATGIEI